MLGQVGSGGLTTGEGSGTAEAFLASQAASLAGQRVGSFIGLDQVQISPLTGGSADLSAARITVGRRISRDVFVTYSYDPSESEEGIFELKWQIYPSISLILTRSDDGSVAGDIRWDTTF
jgi:translocation and assembly module TamB